MMKLNSGNIVVNQSINQSINQYIYRRQLNVNSQRRLLGIGTAKQPGFQASRETVSRDVIVSKMMW